MDAPLSGQLLTLLAVKLLECAQPALQHGDRRCAHGPAVRRQELAQQRDPLRSASICTVIRTIGSPSPLFHAAGIYNGVFTMFDDLSGSVWSHLDGVSTSGVSAGRRLEVRALQTTSWAAWREAVGRQYSIQPMISAFRSQRRASRIRRMRFSCPTGWRSWSGRRDSNPRPSAWEAPGHGPRVADDGVNNCREMAGETQAVGDYAAVGSPLQHLVCGGELRVSVRRLRAAIGGAVAAHHVRRGMTEQVLHVELAASCSIAQVAKVCRKRCAWTLVDAGRRPSRRSICLMPFGLSPVADGVSRPLPPLAATKRGPARRPRSSK